VSSLYYHLVANGILNPTLIDTELNLCDKLVAVVHVYLHWKFGCVGDTTLPADRSYTYLNVDDAKDLRYRKVVYLHSLMCDISYADIRFKCHRVLFVNKTFSLSCQ